MRVWMVFVQGDDATWVEAAWDDEMTASNPEGWEAEVRRIEQMCAEQREYAWRILEVEVPGVYEAFEIPTVTATTRTEVAE